MQNTTERKDDVIVLGGNAKLGYLNRTKYYWQGRDCELEFERAYEIEHINWSEGLRDCVYRVHGREFKDLSCMGGNTLQKYSDEIEIRQHGDGTKFLFSVTDIPTFDSGDREWDSMEHIAVYADSYGINLISCRHGYAIPRINVYIGLKKIPQVFEKWLNVLDWEDIARTMSEKMNNE